MVSLPEIVNPNTSTGIFEPTEAEVNWANGFPERKTVSPAIIPCKEGVPKMVAFTFPSTTLSAMVIPVMVNSLAETLLPDAVVVTVLLVALVEVKVIDALL